jgi:hypothetical protein
LLITASPNSPPKQLFHFLFMIRYVK